MHPRELELILKRNAPFGNQIIDSISLFPRYLINIIQGEPLKIRIEMSNFLSRKSSFDNCNKNHWIHSCYVVVGDNENNLIFLHKLSDLKFFNSGYWEKPIKTINTVKKINAKVISGFIGCFFYW
ncbi:hypothetical protein HZS_7488 [Henneguya salminicola]|nr:hypothetical protein HZS_7488 [Henneguya salminicola]